MRLTIRINEESDKDIYDALSNVIDKTKEIKKYIRRGLHTNSNPIVHVPQLTIPDINLSLPSSEEASNESIKHNLLKNRF